MKHIKKFNESWLNIFSKKKSLIDIVKQKCEIVFNDIFKNIKHLNGVLFEIHKDVCLVRFVTALDDDFGDSLTYMFRIYIHDENIYLKKTGGSGELENFNMFQDMKLPFIDINYLDETLEIFAKKLKPFIVFLINRDNDILKNKYK